MKEAEFYSHEGSVFGTRVLCKLEAVIEWAGDHPSFDDTFIRSLKDSFEQYGSLTIKQWDAMTRIADQFHMDLEEYGYK